MGVRQLSTSRKGEGRQSVGRGCLALTPTLSHEEREKEMGWLDAVGDDGSGCGTDVSVLSASLGKTNVEWVPPRIGVRGDDGGRGRRKGGVPPGYRVTPARRKRAWVACRLGVVGGRPRAGLRPAPTWGIDESASASGVDVVSAPCPVPRGHRVSPVCRGAGWVCLSVECVCGPGVSDPSASLGMTRRVRDRPH